MVCVYAYAYEFDHKPLVDDATFDHLCSQIDLSIDTTNPEMDIWFRENFNPSTGQWIHNHPHINKIKEITKRMRAK